MQHESVVNFCIQRKLVASPRALPLSNLSNLDFSQRTDIILLSYYLFSDLVQSSNQLTGVFKFRGFRDKNKKEQKNGDDNSKLEYF